MKTNFGLFNWVILLVCLWVTASSFDNIKEDYLNPRIQMGKVKISGKITCAGKSRFDKPVLMTFSIVYPITGEGIRKEIKTDELGNYSIELDVETNPVIIGLYTDVNLYKSILLGLSLDKESEVDIYYTDNEDVEIMKSPDGELTCNDMLYGLDLFAEIIDSHLGGEYPSLYDKTSENFLEYAEECIEKRVKLLNKDTLISDKHKKYLDNELALFYYVGHIFDYQSAMKLNYRNVNNRKNIPDSLIIAEPSREYYAFVQGLNLNSNELLCNFQFPEFQEQILLNKTLDIPPIKEIPIIEWLKIVKSNIADVLGFKDGPYYDVLIANAYALQLNMNMKPLSVKQIENIHNYFKGGEIEKILLRKNEETKRISSITESLVIQETPDIADSLLMEAIVEKNKGKVVIVDFWATWCGPCLQAMKDMQNLETIISKNELTHIYFTNHSSPKELWENKIKGIGGQHYYINDKTWEYLMEKYSFWGVPSYLIFNKEGVLIKQMTGYPGGDSMIGLIKEASK